MKSLLKNKKILIPVAVVLIAAIVCCVLFLPRLFKKDAVNYNYKKDISPVAFNKGDFDISFGDGEFLFNSKNSHFAVISNDYKTVFSSQSEEASKDGNCTILSFRLRDKNGNAYFMDTSSNSVPFNTFEITEKKTDLVKVKYTLFSSADEAEKGVDTASAYVACEALFEYKNGKLTVSVDTENMQLPKGFSVEKMSILPGLFSVSSKDNAEFIIPDGSGAVIKASEKTEKSIDLNLSVYGADVAFSRYETGAKLPFLALNKSGQLLNCVIDNGDAISEITCKKQSAGGGYLYNTFNITPCTVENGKFIKGTAYTGVVSQAYTLTNNGDYNDVAVQLRDNLLRKGYLNPSLLSKTGDLPFFINVVGSLEGKNALTTFENAAEITALLKARGVRNISLRYSGYAENGLLSDLNEINSASKTLGGEEKLKELTEKITEQGNKLHLDVNLFTENADSDGAVILYEQETKLCGGTPGEFDLNSKDVNNTVSKVYKYVTSYQSTGVCLKDGSMLLASDLNNKINRADNLTNIQNSIGSLSAVGGFMLSEPAVYLMKQAESVFETPTTAMLDGFAGVTSVPILQMVIHGSVVYGGGLINVTSYSPEDAFLKCIEVGAVPTFLFTHSNTTSISYSTYATQTAKLYSRAKTITPVLNMEMTSHEKVTDGVYKITYDYSKVVYVNYNPSVVEVNGVMISAKDFIVI